MSIGWRDVEAMLITDLPEFGDVVREHRKWPEWTNYYVLIGQLYNFVVDALKNRPNDVGREIARRTFVVVERALVEGDEAVQNCFSIEMIEPLMNLRDLNLESNMGPAALHDLDVKREWSRRYGAMSDALSSANAELGCDIFKGVGVGPDTARVTADSNLWTTLPQAKRDDAIRFLRKNWMVLRGLQDPKLKCGLEITGTREEKFVVLVADEPFDPR